MSFGFTMKKDYRGKALEKSTRKFVETSLKKIAEATLEKAIELCPKRYGHLAASLNLQARGYGTELDEPSIYAMDIMPDNREEFVKEFTKVEKPHEYNVVNIGTNLSYAYAVEYGSVGHFIQIKNKKALSDMVTIFGTRVFNKGHEAQPFMRPALDWTYENFRQIIRDKAMMDFPGKENL